MFTNPSEKLEDGIRRTGFSDMSPNIGLAGVLNLAQAELDLETVSQIDNQDPLCVLKKFMHSFYFSTRSLNIGMHQA